MNLRLRPEAERALRAESDRSGRTQQDILREAVDRYLGTGGAAEPSLVDAQHRQLAAGTIFTPRTPYRRTSPTLAVPGGTASLELLDRDERI